MNSSYVLIKYHTFLQTRERVGARPSASRVSILCCQCAFVLQDESKPIWTWAVFVLWYELRRRKLLGGQMALSDHAQMGLGASDRGKLVQSGDAWM